MKERIKDKINEIEEYLEKLEEALPSDLEEYAQQHIRKAACERYAETIIEAVVDLAFLFIKEKNLGIPESDLSAFQLLSDKKIIDKDLSNNLQNAKRMRNILAHEYGDIDDSIVFQSLKEGLSKDVKEFIKIMKGKM